MSYKCHQTQTVVHNQRRNLVPTQLRKIKYRRHILKFDRRSGKTIDYIDGEFEGVETVKEVSVCDQCLDQFQESNTPEIMDSDKVVDFYVKATKKTTTKPRQNNEDEEDKPDPDNVNMDDYS